MVTRLFPDPHAFLTYTEQVSLDAVLTCLCTKCGEKQIETGLFSATLTY